MRQAYGGRAAAYEQKGDYGRAAADYGMIVFSYAVELDAADPKAEGYNDLLREAAKAYRTRAACLRAKGDAEASARDVKWAEKLEARAQKAEAKSADAPAGLPARVTLRNDWTDALTVVIGGVSYTLQVGETKTLPAPAGSFAYEMQAGSYQIKGTLDSGRTPRIRPPLNRPERRRAMPRPDPTEYAPFYANYVGLVREDDVVSAMEQEGARTLALPRATPEKESLVRHAPYTWSVREVVGHVTDSERVFAYRALAYIIAGHERHHAAVLRKRLSATAK
jgi:DinB family protein